MLDSYQIRRLQGLVSLQRAAGTPITRRDVRLIRGLLFSLDPDSELALEVQGFLLNDAGLALPDDVSEEFTEEEVERLHELDLSKFTAEQIRALRRVKGK